jgi:arylsulfatase
LPTLCEATESPAPAAIDGVSLLNVLKGAEPAPKREYLYWEFPGQEGQQAIRLGQWKAVRTNLAAGPQPWQLYDLSADAAEAHDVAGQHPEVLAAVERIAAEAHVPSPTFPLQSVDAP